MPDGTIGAGPDPNTTVQEANDWFQALLSIAQNAGSAGGVPGFVSVGTALHGAVSLARAPGLVAKIAGTLLGMLADIAAGALNGIEAAKENSGSGFNDLIAAALKDLTGADIQIGGSSDNNATADPAAAGRAVFDAFTQLLGGLNPVTPDQGQQNAAAFLGMGVNFAVVTSFLGIIGGLVPFLHLDELKSIGEDLHQVLGLGRLTHTAITPLVRNTVSQPLDRWLRAQLRPDQLGESQLVRAYHAGQMQDADVRQALAEKGYPDSAIDLLLTDFAVKLALPELFTLLLNGDIQEADVINNLTLAGMPEDQANLQLKAVKENSARSQVSAQLADLESAYVNGFIDESLYSSTLDSLPISDEENAAFRQRVGFKQERPRKKLTFAEIKSAYVDLVIDSSYVDAFLAQEGYDDQAQLVLWHDIIKAVKDETDKAVARKWKADQLRAKGKPVPPWLEG